MSVGHLLGISPPVAADGKPFVLPNIFPSEVLLNFTGAGDSSTARFAGDLFGVEKVGSGDASQTLNFLDGVFLAGGHVEWEGGAYESYVSLDLSAPASTTKAPAVANQGNCNLVPTGLGFNIIVPAAGNGEFDLDVPVPVPSADTETDAPTGWWNYSEPWVGKGTVAPSGASTAKYNLFDEELPLARFAKLHLMSASGRRDLAASAIKPKWVLPEWKVKVTIHNADSGKTLRVAFDLLTARRKSI
jgi:hypothetical protein